MKVFKLLGRRCLSIVLVFTMLLSITIGNVGNIMVVQAEGYGLKNPTDLSEFMLWNCIYFGEYYQSNSSTKEKIKWRVLKVDGNDAFIMADMALDCKPYNDELEETSWATCSLRTWLNNDFYNTAFNEAEKSAIIKTSIENNGNPHYDTAGCRSTEDNIYILSAEEAENFEYGFYNDYRCASETREAKVTPYAIQQGAYAAESDSENAGNGWWWLRTPGFSKEDATVVLSDGFGGDSQYVNKQYNAVRPVLHIDLSSDVWSHAEASSAEISNGNALVVDSSGLSCKRSVTIKSGEQINIAANLYATTESEMRTYCNDVKWSSSDTSIAKVNNNGFTPNTKSAEYGEHTLWWAYGNVVVTGVKKGKVTITGELPNGSKVWCDVTVEKGEGSGENDGSVGGAGSLTIGEDATGEAGGDVGEYYPAEWSLSSMAFPLEMEQEVNDDGTYTSRLSIGVQAKDIFDGDKEWTQFKEFCDNVSETEKIYDSLKKYREVFGITKGNFFKQSRAIHASGWDGDKPKVTILGYGEYTYDKYGNLIKESSGIAGELEFEGDMSWQVVTPAGPIFLNLEAGAGLTVAGGFAWNNKTSELCSEFNKAEFEPYIAIAGGYGFEGCLSVYGKGKLELEIDFKEGKKTKGELEASFLGGAQIGFWEYEYELFGADFNLWDHTDKAKLTVSSSKNTSRLDKQIISTVFANNPTDWNGNQLVTQKQVLQSGVLKSSFPMLAEIDGKQVMVWQAHDSERELANSIVLTYSVLENGVWSEPKAVYDDGYGDYLADMQVIDGKLRLVWQKHKKIVSETEMENAISELSQSSEIMYAEFDTETNTFTNIIQVTENEECDMLPKFVDGTDSVEITFVRNSAKDMLQLEGVNSIYSVSLEDIDTENEIAVSPGTIDRYVSYKQYDSTKAMYVSKTNDMIAVMNSDCNPIDEFNELMRTSEKGTVSSLNYIDGCIHAICNGVLYEYDLNNKKMSQYTAGNGAFDGNATWGSNGSKSGYIWSTYDNDENIGYIKASMKTKDGYSNPVILYETKGEITRYMAPVLAKDGEWNVALNQENAENAIHSLCYLRKPKSVDSKLVYATINENDTNKNGTSVGYMFANEGDTHINTATLTLTGANGTTVKKDIEVNLAPGEVVGDTVYVDLSSIGSGQNLGITMCESSQTPSEEDVVKAEYAKTDISLIGTATQDDKGIQIKVKTKNQGNSEANVDVTLYTDSDMSSQMAKKTGVKVSKGKEEIVSFTVEPKDVVYNENNAAYLTVKADVSGGDYSLGNNVIYLALYKGEKVNANTAPKGTDSEGEDSSTDSNVGNNSNTNSTGNSNNGTISNNSSNKKIKVKRVKIKSAKNVKKKSIQLKWKKIKGAKGYQIQYALNKKFTKKSKKKNTKKISYKITKLKKKKTYFVRVRAYKISKGEKVYGKWSKIKKVKVKR